MRPKWNVEYELIPNLGINIGIYITDGYRMHFLIHQLIGEN